VGVGVWCVGVCGGGRGRDVCLLSFWGCGIVCKNGVVWLGVCGLGVRQVEGLWFQDVCFKVSGLGSRVSGPTSGKYGLNVLPAFGSRAVCLHLRLAQNSTRTEEIGVGGSAGTEWGGVRVH
jgi:hypothetical protein